MGIARSTYYAPPAHRDAGILTRIEAICAEFEAYGYRRVTAELRHQGNPAFGRHCRDAVLGPSRVRSDPNQEGRRLAIVRHTLGRSAHCARRLTR